MRELGAIRTLTAPPVMGAFTGVRAGLAWFEVWAQCAPELTRLGLEFWDPKTNPDDVAERYGDAFVACYEDSVDAALNEIELGTEHVNSFLSALKGGPRSAHLRSARARPGRPQS